MLGWWIPTGSWVGPFREWGRAFPIRWEGPEQVEDKSPANVARAYDYLLKLPYQSTEDRERLVELRFIQMLKAKAHGRATEVDTS